MLLYHTANGKINNLSFETISTALGIFRRMGVFSYNLTAED